MVNVVSKLTAPLARSMRLMVGRAVVRLVNDSLKMQAVQVSLLADEVRDNVERVQEYGFTSHPIPGAEAIVVCVGGSRDHAVVIAVDDRRYRLTTLEQGEVAIYTDEGDSIILKRNNNVEITTDTLTVKAATKVRFETPLVEATGDIIDRVATTGKSMAQMRTTYNSHTHNHPADGQTIPAPNQGM
jgi:phage baseplate assembly protein V